MDTTEIRRVQITEDPVTIECECDEAFSAPRVASLAVAETEAAASPRR